MVVVLFEGRYHPELNTRLDADTNISGSVVRHQRSLLLSHARDSPTYHLKTIDTMAADGRRRMVH